MMTDTTLELPEWNPSLSGNSNFVSVLISILIQHIIIPMLDIVVILLTGILRSKEGTLNIFDC
jgi:hypothetical protein